jgi:hypothetical protein
MRWPGTERSADLPLVTEWVNDPSQSPTVFIAHWSRFAGTCSNCLA